MAVVKLTSSNFEAEVMKSDKPVLIDFYAVWCGPCRMVSPIVDEISEEHEEIKVCKLDVDESPDIAQQFSVSSIPMLVVVKQGKVTQYNVGAIPKSEILQMLK
ncbi:MAG: thioredoxin [Ruminococcus sp.]|jgi:thioredoxin 1|nr:thioredoxin [Ruminococcus sp.]